jgi:hypothetical protein
MKTTQNKTTKSFKLTLISKFRLPVIAMLSMLIVVGCKKPEEKDPAPTPVGNAPTVISTNPASGAGGVAPNQAIVATFSRPMQAATITLPTTFTLMKGSTSVTGTVTYTGTTATFTPATSLDLSTYYTGTITTAAKDTGGIALSSNHVFSFTTGSAPDNTAPTVNTSNPLDNATSVARNQTISVTFSEAMKSSTINAASFTLTDGTNSVGGTVAYSGTTATFNPTNTLAAGTTYTYTLTNAAQDLAGNALANTVMTFTTAGSVSGLPVVNLGTSGNYVILAKTAINNVPTSNITGDLGLSPAALSYATGFSQTLSGTYATSLQVTGKIYAADMTSPTPINLTTAVNDMNTAYNDAAGRPTPDFFELYTGNIGGKTLTPGLYKWTNTVTAPTNVTLSGGVNDVFIFQIAGNLTVSSAVIFTLSGGVQAQNIFWQVAGSTELGTTSQFKGIILCKTGITLKTSAKLDGRALAQTAVILDKNAVTQP